MDKINKILRRLSKKEKEAIAEILTQLQAGSFKNLDIKKLKGRKDIFRARYGNWRIIYRYVEEEIFILAIERRSDKTYKSL